MYCRLVLSLGSHLLGGRPCRSMDFNQAMKPDGAGSHRPWNVCWLTPSGVVLVVYRMKYPLLIYH